MQTLKMNHMFNVLTDYSSCRSSSVSAHPPQRYGGYKARLELLKLFLTLCQAIKARCVNHTFTTKSFKV